MTLQGEPGPAKAARHYRRAESVGSSPLLTLTAGVVTICHSEHPALIRQDGIVMITKIKVEIDPQAGTMELVKQAQMAYDAGRDREWAGILWTAAERAMRELAESRDISGDSAVDILARLDSLDDRPRDGYFSNALGGVGMLRTHYQLGALESYWWEDLHADMVAFIKVCNDAAR